MLLHDRIHTIKNGVYFFDLAAKLQLLCELLSPPQSLERQETLFEVKTRILIGKKANNREAFLPVERQLIKQRINREWFG